MKSIDSEVEKILKDELEKMMHKEVGQVYNEVVAHATHAIVQFYSTYTPAIYLRTYSFMSTPEVTLRKKNKLAYVIDIEYTLPAPVHRDPLGEEYVYQGVIMQGIHGTSAIAVTKSPAEYMDDYLQRNFT